MTVSVFHCKDFLSRTLRAFDLLNGAGCSSSDLPLNAALSDMNYN